MSASKDILDNVLYQFAIHLIALLLTGILGILLNGPDSPQRYVRMFHLVYFHTQRLLLHKLTQALLGGLHDQFEVILLANGQRQAWQCDKRITGTGLEPRIASQQITVIVGLAVVELMGGRYQTVVEAVTAQAQTDLFLKQALQRRCLD